MATWRTAVVVCVLCLCGATGVSAQTYYVHPSGSDSNPGTEAMPFQTVNRGTAALGPGATLYVKSGLYAEALLAIPGGTSWTNRVRVAAYPGHTVTLRPPSGSGFVLHFSGTSRQYIEVSGLILDGLYVAYDGVKITSGAHAVRLVDCEIRNAPQNGVLITGGGGGNEFIGLNVHDNGVSDFNHGFYITTTGNVIEGCDVHRNAGWGVHLYSGTTSGCVVRRNRIHDNARVGPRGTGIGIYSGSGILACNNLVWGNSDGIAVDYGASGALVYNNVVVSNADAGIYVGAGSANARVRNNIVWANGGSATGNAGSGTVFSSNLVGIDPRFVDAAGDDFHLRADSPAIDAGAALAEVPDDFDGYARPAGAGYDIGAFEFGAGPGAGGGVPAGGSEKRREKCGLLGAEALLLLVLRFLRSSSVAKTPGASAQGARREDPVNNDPLPRRTLR